MKKAGAREINERRTVSHDQHATCLALPAGNGSEFPPEVLDVVIDRVEAMLTGLDEELVEGLVERALLLRLSSSPNCLHDDGRIARTRVDGSERNGAT